MGEGCWPFVSIIIPMYNEEKYIAQCLNSILANDYPVSRLEVIVVDGGSTDRSKRIVEEYADQYPVIKVLENPRRFVSSSLNLGLRMAKGEIILRMDAHASYSRDYIRECVRLLLSRDAANVGGVMEAVGEGFIGEAIAIAVTTPFGAGDAYFRFSEKERWVDTVFPGAWRKSLLDALGGFNEEWIVNEDYELNYRLRKSGGKILLCPRVRCRYFVRPTLKALARQYFRYGFWKAKTILTYPESLRWRQLAPPALVGCLLLSVALVAMGNWGAVVGPCFYAVSAFAASVWAGWRKGLKYVPVLPIVYATMHCCWGVGFYIGMFIWGMRGLKNAVGKAL